MNTKFFAFVCVTGLATMCLLQAQSPAPMESPAASPAKHGVHKKSEAAVNPAAGAEASASPAAKRGRKAKTTAAAAAVSPSPSPAKKTLADFFKPRTSASPAAATAPAATGATRAETAARPAPAAGGGHGLVWVNSETHVYHREGTRFYGKTKKGKYITEQEAIKEGDKEAKRE
jgi:hypothetical protein